MPLFPRAARAQPAFNQPPVATKLPRLLRPARAARRGPPKGPQPAASCSESAGPWSLYFALLSRPVAKPA
eukprot:5397305-Lingulodinium_polyedra.AAC.1